MKKKGILIIFILAVLVSVISQRIQYLIGMGTVGWTMLWQGIPFPILMPHNLGEVFVVLLFTILDVLFWFLVLAAGWWVVKWLRRKRQ